MKKKFLFIIILLIILASFFYYRVDIKNLWLKIIKEELPIAIEYQNVNEIKTKNQKPKTDLFSEDSLEEEEVDKILKSPSIDNYQVIDNEEDKLPLSFNLNIPFTSQAPHADWNEIFKEACEEASVLMVDYFYQNKEFTADIATDEILKMVDWEMDYFGGHFDLTASETADMIKKYLNYNRIDVINNPTIDDIKMYLTEQRPIIIPAAGQELGNPYFRQPGPIYHMIVIKGYTETQFITHDPGTRRGEDYLYDYNVIMNAIHDWNENDILQGEKRIIIIYPN